MKVSIITVIYNLIYPLQDTMDSIDVQDYAHIEYITVDGNSSDDAVCTVSDDLINTKWISEPDGGLYDAINKGIRMAYGDIVGIINSDDFYLRSDAISNNMEAFQSSRKQCVYLM